jgi:hypothetical protein
MADDAELKQRRERVNFLFDAVANEKGLRERSIFEGCYRALAEKALLVFLKDVTTCPPEVIAHCQDLLAPKPHE